MGSDIQRVCMGYFDLLRKCDTSGATTTAPNESKADGFISPQEAKSFYCVPPGNYVSKDGKYEFISTVVFDFFKSLEGCEKEGQVSLTQLREKLKDANGKGYEAFKKLFTSYLKKRLANTKQDTLKFYLSEYAKDLGIDLTQKTKEDAVSLLVKALTDPKSDETSRIHTIRTLGNLGSAAEDAVLALTELFAKAGYLEKGAIVDALGAIRTQEAIAGLVKALSDKSCFISASAAKQLGRSNATQDTVSALMETLNNKDEYVRRAAAEALGKIGPVDVAKRALPRLREISKDDTDKLARMAAIYAVGVITKDAAVAVPTLVKALNSEDRKIKAYAANLLGFLGPAAKDTIPALITAFGTDDWFIKQHVAKALGNMGSHAKAAIPALTQALDYGESGVRTLAQEALDKIKTSK